MRLLPSDVVIFFISLKCDVISEIVLTIHTLRLTSWSVLHNNLSYYTFPVPLFRVMSDHYFQCLHATNYNIEDFISIYYVLMKVAEFFLRKK